MRDRGGESWTLGDLGGGGGRVQSLLCLMLGERERARENANTATSVRNGGSRVSLCEAPNMCVAIVKKKREKSRLHGIVPGEFWSSLLPFCGFS